MNKLLPQYWNMCYQTGQTAWDIGYASSPLVQYIDQLRNRELKILIPGAGNAHEAIYLNNLGFNEVYILDFAETPLLNFEQTNPSFPKAHILHTDFFEHFDSYDLILEHTFFSSLPPEKRKDYVTKMHKLLVPNGKLVGLLFDRDFHHDGPPYSGCKEVYEELFKPLFTIKKLEIAYNSIKPRKNTELFFIFEKN